MATSLTLVSVKGAPLTVSEFDTNLTNLRTTADSAAAASVPATILSELLIIDGTGSGLDADLLDGAERTEFVEHADATAESDFLVGAPDPFGSWEVKTLAQTKTILDILDPTADNDFYVGSVSGAWTRKTLAETGAILEGDIVHDNLQDIASSTAHDSRYYTESEVDALLAVVSYYPTSATETGDGSIGAGSYADLADHDASYLQVDEGNGGTGFTLEVGFTDITYFDNVVVFGRYTGGINHQVDVQLYNNTTTNFDDIGIMASLASDAWYAFPVVDPAHYISAGIVLLRFQHSTSGVNTHDLYLDLCALRKGGVAGGGVTEHGSMTGLLDDDHTQYLLRSELGPAGGVDADTVDGSHAAAFVTHALAAAENDFIVASGAGTFVKKTLAETGAILEADLDHGSIQGLGDDDHTQYIKHALATAENDFLVASGSGAYVKKTLAETGAILEADLDHGNLQGLGDDDHTQYIKHALATAANDFLVASGTGVFAKQTLAETKTTLGLGTMAAENTTDWDDTGITFVIDGGGSTLTTGVKGDIVVPFDATITTCTMLADQSGSIVVDIWKDTYANFPPIDADSITASAVPTISTATKSQDGTLTGWTTTINSGDILRFNVDSVTTITRCTIFLKILRT